MRELPVYKCIKCNYVYTAKQCGPTQCPHCLSLYVKWVNYSDVDRPTRLVDNKRKILLTNKDKHLT